MFSESDLSDSGSSAQGEARKDEGEHRYYALGTRERQLRDAALLAKRELDLHRRREAEFQQYPFKPELQRSSSARATTARRAPGAEPEDGGEFPSGSVFQRLARNAEEQERRMRALQKEKELFESTLLARSFQPTINPNAKTLSPSTTRVEDRLLDYGRSVELARRMRQYAKEQDERAAEPCDQPTTARSAHTAATSTGVTTVEDYVRRRQSQKQFEERNNQLLERKEQSRILAEMEEEQKMPFRPKVSETSAALDRARQRSASAGPAAKDAEEGDRALRLYEKAVKAQQEKQLRGEEEAVTDGASHKPKVNPNSKKWIDSGTHKALFQEGFVKRQEIYDIAKREQMEMLKSDLEAGGDVRDTAARVRQSVIDEQVERLYNRRRSATRAEHQDSDEKMDFKPRLAPGTDAVVSRMKEREKDVVTRLSKPPPRYELYEGGKDTKSPAARASATMPSSPTARHGVADRPPFQVRRKAEGAPPPPPPAEAATGAAAAPKRVVTAEDADAFYHKQVALLEKRELFAQEVRKHELVAEMAACTFRPATNVPVSSGDGSGAEPDHVAPLECEVPGAGDFLRRQQMAKRMREEHEERVRSMSHGRSVPSSRPLTIDPFHFETEERSRLARTGSTAATTSARGRHASLSPSAQRTGPASSSTSTRAEASASSPSPSVVDGSKSVTANLAAYKERRRARMEEQKRPDKGKQEGVASLFSLRGDERDFVREEEERRVQPRTTSASPPPPPPSVPPSSPSVSARTTKRNVAQGGFLSDKSNRYNAQAAGNLRAKSARAPSSSSAKRTTAAAAAIKRDALSGKTIVKPYYRNPYDENSF